MTKAVTVAKTAALPAAAAVGEYGPETVRPAVDLSPKAGTAGYARSLPLALLVKANPKRGASAERFALYAGCTTVGDYYDRCKAAGVPAGKTTADLKWDADAKRGFIKLG